MVTSPQVRSAVSGNDLNRLSTVMREGDADPFARVVLPVPPVPRPHSSPTKPLRNLYTDEPLRTDNNVSRSPEAFICLTLANLSFS